MNPKRFPTDLPHLLTFGLETLKERGAHYQLAALLIALLLGLLVARNVFGQAARARALDLYTRLANSLPLSATVVFLVSFTLFSMPGWITGRPLEPLSSDEYGFLLTADTFRQGRLSNPPHPFSEHFENFYLLQQPTYNSKYFPAQAAAIASGWALLGHPMHGVRLSGAVACVALLWMLWGWFDRRWALFGALTAATSFVVFDWNQTYLGGNVALLAGALCLGAVRRIADTPRTRDSLLLGLGLSLLSNSRPYEGLVFGLCLGTFLLGWMATTGRPIGWRTLAARVVAPLLIVMSLNFAWIARYDHAVTGNALTFPYSLYVQRYEAVPLFLFQEPMSPASPTCVMASYNGALVAQFRSFQTAHGLTIESSRRLLTLMITLVSLSCLPFFLLGLGQCRGGPTRYLAALILTCTVAALIIFPFEPYYVAHLLPAILVLTVAGARGVMARVGTRASLQAATGLVPVAQLLVVLAFVAKQGIAPSVGHNLRHDAEADLQSQPGKHLVLVREACSPANWGFVYNDSNIDASKIVWAKELGASQNAALRDYYKDRRSWLLVIEGGHPHLQESPPR